MSHDHSPSAAVSPDETSHPADRKRRDAIVRMAAYTAPIMVAMLVSEKAMATSASGPPLPSLPPIAD